MIVVTGAAGFIGSCLISKLNELGIDNILAVDDFSYEAKNKNLEGKNTSKKIDRKEFINNINDYASNINFIYHIGARTDTTEFDTTIFDDLNLSYSKTIWNFCAKNNVPLVYASSAATYGMGELGFKDDESSIPQLKPLNSYGQSKQDFDVWALEQETKPPFWAGLKFFNVYGPNEYHKDRMASVVMHAYNQIKETGKMRLFRSHNSNYKDGEQLRDFIYVKDLLDVLLFLKESKPQNGIYNLGTGTARTFNDLVSSIFTALDKSIDISYIDTPLDIRDKYQYFTEADMSKLKSVGYNKPFTSVENGVKDYVSSYLKTNQYC